MLNLPGDAQRYFLSFLNIRDMRSVARVCKSLYRTVNALFEKKKIDLVLANPCLYNKILEGDFKRRVWKALEEQENMLLPFKVMDRFDFGGPGIAKKGNLLLIALAGKIQFLVSCNLYRYKFSEIEYQVEYANEELKITDEIPAKNTIQAWKHSYRYNGLNCNGLPVEGHDNSNNWQKQFDYLGRSLFDRKYYLKIIPGERKRIFLIITVADKIDQVFTTVYETNMMFNLLPYVRSWSGSVVDYEGPTSCLILDNGNSRYWVYIHENEGLRINHVVKAVLLKPPCSPLPLPSGKS